MNHDFICYIIISTIKIPYRLKNNFRYNYTVILYNNIIFRFSFQIRCSNEHTPRAVGVRKYIFFCCKFRIVISSLSVCVCMFAYTCVCVCARMHVCICAYLMSVYLSISVCEYVCECMFNLHSSNLSCKYSRRHRGLQPHSAIPFFLFSLFRSFSLSSFFYLQLCLTFFHRLYFREKRVSPGIMTRGSRLECFARALFFLSLNTCGECVVESVGLERSNFTRDGGLCARRADSYFRLI